MQGMVSDKTFHLKWNNHLQNLSQLFTTIYSSSALADVTLSCRDGTLKAHKLVLSACSPYFEQIFKDNPCQHPIVILKGIPFSEINLLVEFMYKGSVDVQELDLQSLMHTAAELEIRGLAYEARDSAAQLLNVNLEYPAYPQTAMPSVSPYTQQSRTDVERLKQIHMYQQSMMRAEEMRRRRRDDPPTTHTAVNNILAAAAREMEEARHISRPGMAHDQDLATATSTSEVKREAEEIGKKRPSILSPDDDKLRVKKKMTVRFQDDTPDKERAKLVSPGHDGKPEGEAKPGGIKVVPMSMLKANNDHGDESDEKAGTEDEETDSNGSVSDSAGNETREGRPHVCDICDQRFHRSTHLSRHRLTHTGERPFTCGGCGRSFARSDKLRVHTKICEKEDPTVDMNMSSESTKRESNSEMMSGMVRTSHRESGHLVFTASGDVMLPPMQPRLLNSTLDPLTNEIQPGDLVEPVRRGRGRPRKTPLPLTPKVKKRRGRPPKTSLDMEGCVLTSGAVGPTAPLSITAAAQLSQRRRGRPPKTFHMSRPMPDGRPNENYNATNLPFGDFAYLTEMMYNPLAFNYSTSGVTNRAEQSADGDTSGVTDTSHDPTIDVSDSSTEEDENSHSRVEPEENVPPVAMETQVMTVGDCQIVKLPPNAATGANGNGNGNGSASSANGDDKAEQVVDNSQVPTTTSSGTVTITPISTVGDCTVRPVENNT